MADVVEIADFRPHYTASLECPLCAHAWIAVFPASCKVLDCPACLQRFAVAVIRPEGA